MTKKPNKTSNVLFPVLAILVSVISLGLLARINELVDKIKFLNKQLSDQKEINKSLGQQLNYSQLQYLKLRRWYNDFQADQKDISTLEVSFDNISNELLRDNIFQNQFNVVKSNFKEEHYDSAWYNLARIIENLLFYKLRNVPSFKNHFHKKFEKSESSFLNFGNYLDFLKCHPNLSDSLDLEFLNDVKDFRNKHSHRLEIHLDNKDVALALISSSIETIHQLAHFDLE